MLNGSKWCGVAAIDGAGTRAFCFQAAGNLYKDLPAKAPLDQAHVQQSVSLHFSAPTCQLANLRTYQLPELPPTNATVKTF